MATASPAPGPKAAPKPWIGDYVAPVGVTHPAITAYSATLTYNSRYIAPTVYSAGIPRIINPYVIPFASPYTIV